MTGAHLKVSCQSNPSAAAELGKATTQGGNRCRKLPYTTSPYHGVLYSGTEHTSDLH